MNKANFLTHERFPADSETWDFLQELTKMAAQLTALGGRNYILSGCEISGTSVTKGYIVIEGELLPFENGTLATHVVISGDKKSVAYEGVDYTNLYEYRTARFGSGSPQYPWSSFKRISDLLTLENKVKTDIETAVKDLETSVDTDLNERMPKGAIVMWAGKNIPKGWALCDGSNGTPNLIERFVMGTGNLEAIGRIGGANSVTLAPDQIPKHSHNIFTDNSVGGDTIPQKNTYAAVVGNSNGSWNYIIREVLFGPPNRALTSEFGGGLSHENRPPYYILAFIQKL